MVELFIQKKPKPFDMKYCVIVPIFNHPEKLASLTRSLLEKGLPIILIDDGSAETCHQVIREVTSTNPDITLITHKENKGKGAAIKTGLRKALQSGFSHAIQIDADGQHELNDIDKFIAKSKEFPEALIAGYPKYDASVPKHRYYSRYASHIWVWINTLSTHIIDSMCGYRIYPTKLSVVLIQDEKMGDRMDFDGEFIVRWYWRGHQVKQLQTKVIYPADGISHFNLIRDNKLISLMHARLFFGMLLRIKPLLSRKWKAS